METWLERREETPEGGGGGADREERRQTDSMKGGETRGGETKKDGKGEMKKDGTEWMEEKLGLTKRSRDGETFQLRQGREHKSLLGECL